MADRAVLTAIAELVLREARARKQPRKPRTQTYTNKVHGIDKKSRTLNDVMDEIRAAGHAGGGDPVDLPLDKAQESLQEGWSPQARAAALEARRKKDGSHHPTLDAFARSMARAHDQRDEQRPASVQHVLMNLPLSSGHVKDLADLAASVRTPRGDAALRHLRGG